MAWPSKANEAKNPGVVALASRALEILEVAMSPIYNKTVVEGHLPTYDELKTLGFIMGVLKDVSHNVDETNNPYAELDDDELAKAASQFLKFKKTPKENKKSTEE